MLFRTGSRIPYLLPRELCQPAIEHARAQLCRCLRIPNIHFLDSDNGTSSSDTRNHQALRLQRPTSLTGQSSYDDTLEWLWCTVLLSVRHAYHLRLTEGIVAEGVVLGHSSHPRSNPKALGTLVRQAHRVLSGSYPRHEAPLSAAATVPEREQTEAVS